MLFVVALVSAYLLFFFVSESHHLFKAPISNAKRRRWKFARHAGFIHFVAAVAGIALVQFWSIELTLGLLIYVVLSLLAHAVAYCFQAMGQVKTKSARGKAKSTPDSSSHTEKLKAKVKSETDSGVASQNTVSNQTYLSRQQQTISSEPATGTEVRVVNAAKKEPDFVVDEAVNITL